MQRTAVVGRGEACGRGGERGGVCGRRRVYRLLLRELRDRHRVLDLLADIFLVRRVLPLLLLDQLVRYLCI